MAAPPPEASDRAGVPADPLERALRAVLADARNQVAAGRAPDRKALESRIRGAAERRRADLGGDAGERVAETERAALRQLDRVLAVQRAYRRLAQPPAAPPPPENAPAGPAAPRRFGGFRARPTVSGTLDVRRSEVDGTVALAWDPVPAVRAWEVRFGVKPDARSDYEPRETILLEPGVTHVAVPLGEHQLRVSVIGQARDGRPVRRVLISALTAENWNDRWERRATAS